MAQSGHPKGLYLLFATEMAERFSYYGMRALFVLYLVSAFFTNEQASQIYGSYTGLVYLTPLLGGYIADRYWGNRRSIEFGALIMAIGQFLMFASACFVQQSIFTKGGSIDSSVNNSLSMWLMFAGLAALIFGNGFFKPNISTMVGDLYEPQDHRKDSAFTIFYMGINLGAFIAPLVCGYFGTGDWTNPGAFKWGFFCAGVAMIVCITIFRLFKDKYIVTPDGQQIGIAPHTVTTEKHTETHHSKAPSSFRTAACLVGGLVLFILFALPWGNILGDAATASFLGELDLNSIVSAAIYAISIALPLFIITDKSLTKIEKMRIGVIYIIAVFVIFFWSAFEQAGSSLTIFADQQCDRHIGSWEMPTTWFQSINPIVVVLFAPVMALLWETLAKFKLEPNSPVKQVIGLVLLSIGYFVIAYGTNGVTGSQKASMWWLFALYFIHTIGELSLSPIGLSLVSKLSPARLGSLLMGVWFMSNAASNILAGKLATLLPSEGQTKSFCGIEIATLTDFFLLFAIISGIAAVLLLAICPLLKRMMKGIE